MHSPDNIYTAWETWLGKHRFRWAHRGSAPLKAQNPLKQTFNQQILCLPLISSLYRSNAWLTVSGFSRSSLMARSLNSSWISSISSRSLYLPCCTKGTLSTPTSTLYTISALVKQKSRVQVNFGRRTTVYLYSFIRNKNPCCNCVARSILIYNLNSIHKTIGDTVYSIGQSICWMNQQINGWP